MISRVTAATLGTTVAITATLATASHERARAAERASCIGPCVALRIESTTDLPVRVEVQTSSTTPLAGADSSGRLELTTPARLVVPRAAQRIRFTTARPHAIRIVFDSAATVAERQQRYVWGSDVLLVHGDEGYAPASQIHPLEAPR